MNIVLIPSPDWLTAGSVSHIVLVIMSQEGGTVLERWGFDTKLVDRKLVDPFSALRGRGKVNFFV
jgi:hypothetical protein